LKTRGVGSCKIVYIEGIPSFENLSPSSADLAYTNFELYPEGLIARISQTGKTEAIVISKNEIDSFHFESRKIRIRKRYGYKIVHDAKIQFFLSDGRIVKFYSPVTFYEIIKNYFEKKWLKSKTHFQMNPSSPINDLEGDAFGLIFRLFG